MRYLTIILLAFVLSACATIKKSDIIENNHIISTLYSVDNEEIGKAEYQYDKDSNILEKISYSANGKILYSEEYLILNGQTIGKTYRYPEGSFFIPRFVENDFIEFNKISRISKFRSGTGHSYEDSYETCRSMKHLYYVLPEYAGNDTVKIFSPVDGKIIDIKNEGYGDSSQLRNKQIWIRSKDYPEITFILFHVNLLDNTISLGRTVTHGMQIGFAKLCYPEMGEQQSFTDDYYATDIAVLIGDQSKGHLISYFETMTDKLFQFYTKRGIKSRESLIISRFERDNSPLKCISDKKGAKFSKTNKVEAKNIRLK